MASTMSAKIGEIIFARFDPGEDLRQGLLGVIKEKKVRSGIVMSITGALTKAHLEHWHQLGDASTPIGVIDVPGPLEVSGHGLIGEVEAPAFGKTPFGIEGEFVHGEPYLHVHLTTNSAKETICGHVLNGCPVRERPGSTESHFTVIIGRIEGAVIKLMGAPGAKPGSYTIGHRLVKL